MNIIHIVPRIQANAGDVPMWYGVYELPLEMPAPEDVVRDTYPCLPSLRRDPDKITVADTVPQHSASSGAEYSSTRDLLNLPGISPAELVRETGSCCLPPVMGHPGTSGLNLRHSREQLQGTSRATLYQCTG